MSGGRLALGRTGEDRAAALLRRKGCRILERNYRVAYGEIDIIARQGETILFVEVKARSGTAFGQPGEAVTYRKQQTIRRVALGYLQSKDWMELPVRFDVIEVLHGERGWTLNHIEQAF